jgi:CheY-like chemotaxis protein
VAVKILAADDSATMRKVVQMTFAGEAVEVDAVDSGEAAVERALHSSPDLVIADVSMAMDGYEVAKALKSNSATQSVAVIVLASQHHPFDAERGKAAGVDDHILKPYDSQAMIEKAKEVLARPRAKSGGAPAVAAAPPPRPVAATPAAAPPQAPAPPRPPTSASPPRPNAPGAGRPGAIATQATSRSTVSFGTAGPPVPPGLPSPSAPKPPAPRPMLELAEEERAPVKPATPSPAQVAPKPVAAAPKPAAPATPAAPVARPAAAVAAATADNGDMAAKLADLGLTREQIEGVLGLSREVIERVVWEVVPDLAETIIREEIKRLTAE